MSSSAITQIIDLARWAPSGDNTQPWRFELVDDRHFTVHGFDTRDHVVYDLDGHPSQLAIGTLLETIAIAATGEGLRAEFTRRADAPEAKPVFDVDLVADDSLRASPLIVQIPRRSVQRRPFSTRALRADEKAALEAAAGSGFRVVWLESAPDRWRAALLMFRNAKLRLTMREAFEVHRAVIHWGVRFSEDRVPDQALGVDALTLRLMRSVMKSWGRIRFFNRYLAGTVAPRLQMDLLPGLLCAAHFALVADRPAQTIDDYVAAGRAVQRFWLTATGLGLMHQPELTPLIFGRYVRDGVAFSADAVLVAEAGMLRADLAGLLGDATEATVWLGRIGEAPLPRSRSTRRAPAALLR